MWKNMVESDRPQMTVWRLRFVCRITKAKNTHLEYAIFTAVARQQWLRERSSMLCLYVRLMYTYILIYCPFLFYWRCRHSFGGGILQCLNGGIKNLLVSLPGIWPVSHGLVTNVPFTASPIVAWALVHIHLTPFPIRFVLYHLQSTLE